MKSRKPPITTVRCESVQASQRAELFKLVVEGEVHAPDGSAGGVLALFEFFVAFGFGGEEEARHGGHKRSR